MSRRQKSGPSKRPSTNDQKEPGPIRLPILGHAADEQAEQWFTSGLPQEGPISLFQSCESREGPHTITDLVTGLRQLLESKELKDPNVAPGHFAKLVEALVWRFQQLVHAGVLDEALPRLTALPILYSPRNGKGAAEWEMARQIFETKRVSSDAGLAHHGFESSVARRVDYGLAAETVARLISQASIEFPRFSKIRERAVAVWVQQLRRKANTSRVNVTWYHCGDCLLKWPHWLDECGGLPNARSKAPVQYRRVAKGILSEFFATPKNHFAERIAKTSASGKDAADAFVEAKRLILEALDRL